MNLAFNRPTHFIDFSLKLDVTIEVLVTTSVTPLLAFKTKTFYGIFRLLRFVVEGILVALERQITCSDERNYSFWHEVTKCCHRIH